MKDYITKIRKKIGRDSFIHPAARIVIENAEREILLIKRTDNGQFGLVAGAFEEGETIEDCIRREVLEETGLRIIDLEVIGISSNPMTEKVVYSNGDQIQYFTVEFYSNTWEKTTRPFDAEEVISVGFYDKSFIEKLPNNERSTFESLDYFRKSGKILVK